MTTRTLPIESMWGEDWEQHARALSRMVDIGGHKTLLEGNLAIIRRKDAPRTGTNRIYRDVSAVSALGGDDGSCSFRVGYAVMAEDGCIVAVAHVDVFGLVNGKSVIDMMDGIIRTLFLPPGSQATILDCAGHMSHFPAVLARLFRKVSLKKGADGLSSLSRARVETALGKMPLEKRALLVFGTAAALAPSEQLIWSPTRSRKTRQSVRESVSEEVRLMEMMRDLPHFGVWKLPSSRPASPPVGIISTGEEMPTVLNIETLAIRRRTDCLVALLGRVQDGEVCLFALILVDDELVADTAALADLSRQVAASAMSHPACPRLVPASRLFRATMAADNAVNAFFPEDDCFPEREAGSPEVAATRSALRDAKAAVAYNERMLQQMKRHASSVAADRKSTAEEQMAAARHAVETQEKAEELLAARSLVAELQGKLDSLTSSQSLETSTVRAWLWRERLPRLMNVKDPLMPMLQAKRAA